MFLLEDYQANINNKNILEIVRMKVNGENKVKIALCY